MKFEADFINLETDKRMTVEGALTPDEIAKARASDDPDLFAQAYALRHAYREVPDGFRHMLGGIRFTYLQ
jgi:hypothetical protein